MKSKIAKILGVLLILSLMLMAMPTPVAASGPDLSIGVNPPDGSSIFCGATPTLTATVSNATGADCAEDVVITAVVLEDPPNATLSSPDPADGLLYDICPDSSKQATWTLTCDGPGPVTVRFTATPTNGDPKVVTVTYNQLCKLEVEITEPDDGDSFDISDTFAVTATVTNNTSSDCTGAVVTLSLVGNAIIVGGNATYTVDLPAGDTQELNWTMHCEGTGDVELTVTADGCGQTGGCATACADTITIHQPPLEECGLDLVITSLPVGEICVGTSFTIEGYVENTGTKTLTGVDAQLTATSFPTSVSIVPSGWNLVTSSLVSGDTAPVSWTVTCTGREQQGAGEECLDELIDFTAEARATCETSDDMSDSETLLDWANQKFVIVTLLPPTVTCSDFCVDDEWLVDVEVHNCMDEPAEGVIEITVGGNAVIITPPNATQEIAIPASGTVKLSDQGGPLPWHVKCISAGDVDITVKFLGVVGITTLCDEDTATIHQKTPADLAVTVDAPDYAQYCDEFPVTADVTNLGGANAAPVSNVNVIMTATGHVEQIGIPLVTGDTDGDGLLDQDETWVYTWTYHCDGWDDASFRVDVTGDDAVCGGSLSNYYTDYTEQIKLDIKIIDPDACDIFNVCDTFCVTAEITDNDGDTVFSGLNAVITFPNGKASLVTDETDTKPFNLGYGDTQQVSWTVHCDEPGDTDIMVEVTGSGGGYQLTDKKDTITVHQVETELGIEIISPDTGSKYATSEEFAVTAVITNNAGIGTVTITDANVLADGAEVVAGPVPEVSFDIEPGKSKTVTWTLHCVESGLTLIGATADGVGESGREVEADSNGVLVWQYPAAGLVVEIIEEPEEPVVTCTTFDVTARIWNTGEADATEVYATLSVTPEGSVRVSEDDEEGTYTKYVGTIPGHGSEANYQDVTWNLHCKVACDSEIVVTASGNDEYGWHIKQECQTSGTFVIYEGYEYFETLWTYETPSQSGEYGAWTYGYFEGDANGLIGPFNFDAGLQFAALGGGPDFFGHITGMGMVIPNASLDGDDVLAWVAHITLDKDFLGIYKDIWTYDVCGGLLQVINGNLNGAYLKGYENNGCTPEWEVGLLNGTYCSTMASTPGLAIPEKFIEPDGFTVKQLEPPADADLAVEKLVNDEESITSTVGEEVTFTVTVENFGEADATSIWVWDLLPAGVNFESWDADQGFYYVGSGQWSVGDLAYDDSATLTIVATVNTDGEIHNMARVDYCDQHDPVTTNNADMVTITVPTPAPPEPYTEWTITVDEGWNLVSLPIIPGITAPHDIPIDVMTATLAELIAIYGYDPEGVPPDDFPWYYPGAPPGTYPLEVMVDGYGYWVQMVDPGVGGSFTFDGWELVAETDPPSLPPSYAVVEGWNLIGFKSTTPKLAAEYLAGIADKYVMIYGYDDGFFIAGSPGHEMLQPGLGYWIALKDGEFGTIFP